MASSAPPPLLGKARIDALQGIHVQRMVSLRMAKAENDASEPFLMSVGSRAAGAESVFKARNMSASSQGNVQECSFKSDSSARSTHVSSNSRSTRLRKANGPRRRVLDLALAADATQIRRHAPPLQKLQPTALIPAPSRQLLRDTTSSSSDPSAFLFVHTVASATATPAAVHEFVSLPRASFSGAARFKSSRAAEAAEASSSSSSAAAAEATVLPSPVRLPSPPSCKQQLSQKSRSWSPTAALLPVAHSTSSASLKLKTTAIESPFENKKDAELSFKKLRKQMAPAIAISVALGLPLLLAWVAITAHYSAAAIGVAFAMPSTGVICFLVTPVGPGEVELALPRETKAEQRNRLQQLFDPAAKSVQGLRIKANEMRKGIAKGVSIAVGDAVQRCLPCCDVDEETLFPSMIQLAMGLFGLITAYSLLSNLHRVPMASALILGTCAVVQVQDCLGWIFGELLGFKAVANLRDRVNMRKDAMEESCTKAADGLVSQARGLAIVWGCLPSAEQPLKRRRSERVLSVLVKMDQIGALTRSSPLKCLVTTLNLIVFFDSLRVGTMGAFVAKNLELPTFDLHKLQTKLALYDLPTGGGFTRAHGGPSATY